MFSRSKSRVAGGPPDAGAEASAANERMVETRPIAGGVPTFGQRGFVAGLVEFPLHDITTRDPYEPCSSLP